MGAGHGFLDQRSQITTCNLFLKRRQLSQKPRPRTIPFPLFVCLALNTCTFLEVNKVVGAATGLHRRLNLPLPTTPSALLRSFAFAAIEARPAVLAHAVRTPVRRAERGRTVAGPWRGVRQLGRSGGRGRADTGGHSSGYTHAHPRGPATCCLLAWFEVAGDVSRVVWLL